MKLLIGNHVKFTEEQMDKLRELGFEPYIVKERKPCPEELLDAEAALCYQLFNYNALADFPAMRLIHTTSAGLDHMPLETIRARGITLFNAGGVYSAPMAEFALCGVLQIYKEASLFRSQQQAHEWKQHRDLLEMTGKRLCVVGAGSIGTETAKRFSAMGCHVTGLCRHPAPKPYFDEVRSVDELHAVLSESDIVTLSLPLTDDTRHLISTEQFRAMKDGAVLVNMARGPVVDTEALLEALAAKKLRGAVIDVCEEEPLPPESPLWDAENVILTPHNSFLGEGNNDRLFALVYQDFKNYLERN